MLETKDEVIQYLQKAILLSSSFPELDLIVYEIRTLYDECFKFFHSTEFRLGNKSLGSCFLEALRKYSLSLSNIFTAGKQVNKYLKVKLKNRIKKIKVIIHCLPLAYNLKSDDFRCLNDDHPRKLALKSVTKTISLNKSSIKSQVSLLSTLLNSIKASIMNFLEYKKSNSSCLFTGFNILYYLYYPKERKMYSRIYEMNETLDDLILYLNLLDSSLLKQITSLMLEKILINQLIYVPRLACHVLDSGRFKQVLKNEKFYFADENRQRVQIRVLSAIPIPSLSEKYSNSKTIEVDFVVIDVHGGAHLGLSSFTHQSYTRRWANSLKVPIFALDYRLAPEHKFPAGLDDAWQAYTWLVLNMEKFLKIKTKKIVLAGDSAGGNLAIGICLKAKKCGFRLPDGLFCIYPCVNWDREHISQGTLQSLDDFLLPQKLFSEFHRYYLGSVEETQHHFVSPIYADKSLLAGFPKTKFLLPAKDPLYYDTLEFAERLIEAGVDIEIYEYLDFVHGCMSLTSPYVSSVFDVSFDDSIHLFRKLGID